MISSFDKSKPVDDRVLDPEKNIQAFLKKNDFGILCRDNCKGCSLVSGLVRSTERTDQTIFDMLNTEASAFEFVKIYAHVDDTKFAKKRLLSRSARYSGLLDKLDFTEAVSPGALPTSEQIKQYNISNWIAVVEENHLETLNEIYDIAFASKGVLENVGILLVNAFNLDVEKSKEIVDKFHKMSEGYMDKADKRAITLPIEYHIVAVGKLEDYPEGSAAYAYDQIGTKDGVLPEGLEFSRELAMRVITDMLQCDVGSCKALAFAEVYDANATEAKLIKGLREGGFNHAEEIEYMLKDAPKVHNHFIKANPSFLLRSSRSRSSFQLCRNTKPPLPNLRSRHGTRAQVTADPTGGKLQSTPTRALKRQQPIKPRKREKPRQLPKLWKLKRLVGNGPSGSFSRKAWRGLLT